MDAAGALSPDSLSDTGRREVRHLLRSHSLELTALGCPLRHGLDVPENQEARIDHVKKVLTLSFDLGPRTVIVQASSVAVNPEAGSARWLTEALLSLGHFGDRAGTLLALETGLESGQALAEYLAGFDTGGIGANLDPANLLMNGFDPIESTRALRGRVVHVHAKDARTGRANRSASEVALGNGDIEWMEFLSVLEEIGYRGWLVVARETGDNRLADIANGVNFLRRLGV